MASKEILVLAGEIVMEAARRKGVRVLPVDSEHNAIFQCLEGRPPADVKAAHPHRERRPFLHLARPKLSPVSRVSKGAQAPDLDHGERRSPSTPATSLQQGPGDVIEARHGSSAVEMARVEVIVHPQSIVHSMVEFIDGSVLAQLSVNDMCFPIQYAITWPERVPNTLRPLDFAALAKLDFEAPRTADFPALGLARSAGEAGGTLPAVFNAANEVAVAAFLDRRCSFPAIWETVGRVMQEHHTVARPELDAILEADTRARTRAAELLAL